MIRFNCTTCKKSLKAPDEGVGRKIHCPKCGQKLLIPAPYQTRNKTVLGQSLPPMSATSSQPVNANTMPGAGHVVASEDFVCPGCKVPIKVPMESVGKWIECPRCNTGFAALSDDLSTRNETPARLSSNKEIDVGIEETVDASSPFRKVVGFLNSAIQLFLFATAISFLGGAFADFITPVFPLNGVLCVGSAAVAILLLFMFLGFRGQGLGLACYCLVVIAGGFGIWWALAEYKGTHSAGFLAANLRPIAHLQTSFFFKSEHSDAQRAAREMDGRNSRPAEREEDLPRPRDRVIEDESPDRPSVPRQIDPKGLNDEDARAKPSNVRSDQSPKQAPRNEPAGTHDDQKRNLAGLEALLLTGSTAEKIRACNELAALGATAKPASRALCTVTVSEHFEIRRAALEALEKINPVLVKPVTTLLVDQNDASQAALELGNMQEAGSPAIPVLIWRMNRQPSYSADAFITALAGVGPTDPDAVHAIMSQISWPGHNQRLNTRREPIAPLRALGALAQSQGSLRKEIIACLLKAIKEYQQPTSVYLQNHQNAFLGAAIDSLGAFGTDAREGIDTLRDLKLHKDQMVRDSAETALVRIQK